MGLLETSGWPEPLVRLSNCPETWTREQGVRLDLHPFEISIKRGCIDIDHLKLKYQYSNFVNLFIELILPVDIDM